MRNYGGHLKFLLTSIELWRVCFLWGLVMSGCVCECGVCPYVYVCPLTMLSPVNPWLLWESKWSHIGGWNRKREIWWACCLMCSVTAFSLSLSCHQAQPSYQIAVPNPQWQCFFSWQAEPGYWFTERLEISWQSSFSVFHYQQQQAEMKLVNSSAPFGKWASELSLEASLVLALEEPQFPSPSQPNTPEEEKETACHDCLQAWGPAARRLSAISVPGLGLLRSFQGR